MGQRHSASGYVNQLPVDLVSHPPVNPAMPKAPCRWAVLAEVGRVSQRSRSTKNPLGPGRLGSWWAGCLGRWSHGRWGVGGNADSTRVWSVLADLNYSGLEYMAFIAMSNCKDDVVTADG